MRNKALLTALLLGLLGYPAGIWAGEIENRITDRPDEGQGPTQVQFFVFVIDIYNIDGASQSFATNVFIRLRWKDKRLSHNGTSVRRLPLDKVWNPRIDWSSSKDLFGCRYPRV
jgi:hypothetical protein